MDLLYGSGDGHVRGLNEKGRGGHAAGFYGWADIALRLRRRLDQLDHLVAAINRHEGARRRDSTNSFPWTFFTAAAMDMSAA